MTNVTPPRATAPIEPARRSRSRWPSREPVTVTGTPTLALNSGGTASYSGGSGGSTLSFTYTIAGGENSADLDYTATSSLALAGGTIKDAATNNATLTLPAVGGASSIGGQKTIVVDTTNPTASVTTPAVDGNTYNASSLPASLAGGSADTGGSSTVSSVQVAIQDGAGNYWGGATFNQGSIFYNAAAGTTSWTYSTATLVGQLTDGHTYTITARSTDAAGNTGTTTRTFVYDTTAPTVTNVTSTKADGAYSSGTSIPVTVTFSENVTVTGSPTLALNSGGTATYSSGSGTSTLTFNYTTSRRRQHPRPRLLGHKLARAVRRHDQGRGHEQRDPDAPRSRRRELDRRPEGDRRRHDRADRHERLVEHGGRRLQGGRHDPRSGDVLENVDVTGAPTLALNSGGTATYSSGSGSSTLTFNYTVGAGDTAADLDYSATNSLALAGGTIEDAATNNATLTLPTVGGASSLGGQKAIVVDTTNPAASITAPAFDGTPTTPPILPASLAGGPRTRAAPVSRASQVAIQDGARQLLGRRRPSTQGSHRLQRHRRHHRSLDVLDRRRSSASSPTATPTRSPPTRPTPPATPSTDDPHVRLRHHRTDRHERHRHERGRRVPAGATIHVHVTFSKAVTVTGTPKLTSNTTPSRTANFAGGSGTSTLTFDYTVQAGDNAATLDYASTERAHAQRRHDPRRLDERRHARPPDPGRSRLALGEQEHRDQHDVGHGLVRLGVERERRLQGRRHDPRSSSRSATPSTSPARRA